MIYWQLILVYLKIGMFGFGGGYAMLSLIQYEVVDHHHWLTLQQFTDVVAISQMTPGPIGINSATYVGYAVTQSVWGAVVTTIAVCLPSFISNRAAAAINDTDMGSSPDIAALMYLLSLHFTKK